MTGVDPTAARITGPSHRRAAMPWLEMETRTSLNDRLSGWTHRAHRRTSTLWMLPPQQYSSNRSGIGRPQRLFGNSKSISAGREALCRQPHRRALGSGTCSAGAIHQVEVSTVLTAPPKILNVFNGLPRRSGKRDVSAILQAFLPRPPDSGTGGQPRVECPGSICTAHPWGAARRGVHSLRGRVARTVDS